MAILTVASSRAGEAADPGPITVCRENPIWFCYKGKALFMSGSHTWATFQERGVVGKTPDFDYPAYLDFMQKDGQNFLRLWTWEQARGMQFCGADVPIRYAPLPYLRTGPGLALDGKPKFDVTRFNEAYFQRLRERVATATKRGICVSVMFFQGFSVEQKGTKGVDPKKGNPWDGHPFNRNNNINGINGDANSDGEGTEVHTLAIPAVTRLQEAYVRKVIDTLNDEDLLVWEIGNECHPGSVEWQERFIRYIRAYEAKKPKQHLIGMTGAPIKNPPMLASSADWISPIGKNYIEDPPPADGRKVIVVDTDHISPWGTHPSWVWKNLCRGNNFIVMDAWHDARFDLTHEHPADYRHIRLAMGDAVRIAAKLNLNPMKPLGSLASTDYCLAAPGREYLVYLPKAGEVVLDLSAAKGELKGEWFDTVARESKPAQVTGGGKSTLHSPFQSPSVLWLKAE